MKNILRKKIQWCECREQVIDIITVNSDVKWE